MRRARRLSLALLAVLCAAGSAAAEAGTGWRVMPVTRLGPQPRSRVVFPHSHGTYWVPDAISLETFWFTATGALAGFWAGDPSSASTGAAGLYVGYVGAEGTSAKVLSHTQNGTSQSWFALARADDLHTILWANGDGKQFSATVNKDGTVGPSQRLHICFWPFGGASNPNASAQLLIGGAHLGGNRLACSPVLLW